MRCPGDDVAGALASISCARSAAEVCLLLTWCFWRFVVFLLDSGADVGSWGAGERICASGPRACCNSGELRRCGVYRVNVSLVQVAADEIVALGGMVPAAAGSASIGAAVHAAPQFDAARATGGSVPATSGAIGAAGTPSHTHAHPAHFICPWLVIAGAGAAGGGDAARPRRAAASAWAVSGRTMPDARAGARGGAVAAPLEGR